jgi:DNA polymerase-3 subunit alpha
MSGQSSLFGGGDDDAGVAVVAPPLPLSEPWSMRDRSAREKEVLGFYFSEHPLEPLREELRQVASHGIADALALGDGAEVRLAGVVGEVRQIMTRAGRRMAAIQLEDLTGRLEATVFPDAFDAARGVIAPDTIVVAQGRIEVQEDRGTKFLVSEIRGWDEARSLYRPSLHIEVRAEELTQAWLEGVDEILSSCPGDCEVYLHIVMPDRSRQVSRSRRFRVADGPDVVARLRERFSMLRARWGKGSP